MGILPSFLPGLQQQINNINKTSTEETQVIGRSFLFDFETGKFVIKDGQVVETDEIAALQQWIVLCVKTTSLDKYNVYKDTGFGLNIDDIIGQKRLNDFYMAELIREVKEGLLKNSQIESVNNVVASREKATLNLSIDVKLKNGQLLSQSVVISVV